MGDPIGATSFVGVGLETNAGTAVKSQVELPFTSESLEGKGEPIRSKAIHRKRAAGRAVMGAYRADGDITFEATPDKITKLLYATLASLNTTGAADPYTHTFTTADSLKPLTVQIKRGDTYHIYPGCFPSKLSFKAVIDEILNGTISLASMATEVIYNAEQSDVAIAAPADDPFVFHQGVITLHGAANDDTNNWDISIDTGLSTPKGIRAGRAPNRAYAGESVVSGSFDLVFNTMAEHSLWMGNAAVAYPLSVQKSLQTLAISLVFTLSANRSLQIDLPKAYYSASEKPVKGKEVIIQRCQFSTLYDTVAASDIKITVKNGEPNNGAGGVTTLGVNIV